MEPAPRNGAFLGVGTKMSAPTKPRTQKPRIYVIINKVHCSHFEPCPRNTYLLGPLRIGLWEGAV